MTPEAAASRRDRQLLAALSDVGAVAVAVVGMPAAQRGYHSVEIVATRIDGEARPIERTLRKLTLVDRLLRSGAIDRQHAAAIDLSVAAADHAFAGCARVASYGEGGGGSTPTGAAAAARGRMLDRVGAS